ncbi:MAG: hypothetical protein GWN61_15100 [candidate division Zixibacteria bacterium]|nr:hypothetical protein [candidate division Zixibacteria bacterium]NIS47254.1 hypothetical protein [candidate division Zixibacteria bacterium]NIU15391.1 hypothetical protein [candidate division Zixibacteria bacterium]NIV07460.1 hypothetical protein [candidate division Zixibacteria bacterium]NIW46648.1 hypothetical protein [Gammaproteobacteria bacterium]
MNAIADEYSDHGVGSIFIYTHEAHPGENYPPLTSMVQKLSHARDLRDVLGVTRPILADTLSGECHRAFGSMPNMNWIFTRSGMPVYKSDWTDARSIQNAVEYFLGVKTRRRSGERLAPFHVERLDFRNQDHDAFYAGLERNGPKAVREIRESFG